MKKYTFLVYHKEYSRFLERIQELGALHVIEKPRTDIREKSDLDAEIQAYTIALKKLNKRTPAEKAADTTLTADEIVAQLHEAEQGISEDTKTLAELKAELDDTTPWGEFSGETIAKLKANGIELGFYTIPAKELKESVLKSAQAELIHQDKQKAYVVSINPELSPSAWKGYKVNQPKRQSSEIENEIHLLEKNIRGFEGRLDELSSVAIPTLEEKIETLEAKKHFGEVLENSQLLAENTMNALEGWVPETKLADIEKYLKKKDIFYLAEKPNPNEQVPVLLKNNRFSKLFEPIGKLFSLPSYQELDLTVFFAPFFMLFFGFCLGDAGYGLLFLIGAAIYKLKAPKDIKPILTLVQYLGAATIVFGAISGTLFGINLIEADIPAVEKYKGWFLNSDNMFNLALALGAIQIVFGLVVRMANQIKQFGVAASLATFGWIFTLVGSGTYGGLTAAEIIEPSKGILYAILGTGAFFILFFSDVTVSIPARVGKGVWDIYSTVTGIFGDLLSYIRLFALGLSSAILGFVINDIAMQILGSNPILGPVFFVIFLLLGHGLNIMISSLGSFVHPMRLTFVEFYKNAGFAGGGKEYKPFAKTKQ